LALHLLILDGKLPAESRKQKLLAMNATSSMDVTPRPNGYSREEVLSQVQPLTKSREETRIQLWMEKLENELKTYQEASWAQWKTLNRLRTRTGRSKDALVRWGY